MQDDLLTIGKEGSRPSVVNRAPDMSRQERLELERLAREYAPDFIADGLAKLNRLAESVENVEDALNPTSLIARKLWREMTLEEAQHILRKGDHIAVSRGIYSHHGIYDGAGWVFAYDNGFVGTMTLADFADGADVYRVDDEALYSPEEIMRRAMSRFGEMEYHIVFNNCEHFACWCRHGE
jgi:hypothetical protein